MCFRTNKSIASATWSSFLCTWTYCYVYLMSKQQKHVVITLSYHLPCFIRGSWREKQDKGAWLENVLLLWGLNENMDSTVGFMESGLAAGWISLTYLDSLASLYLKSNKYKKDSLIVLCCYIKAVNDLCRYQLFSWKKWSNVTSIPSLIYWIFFFFFLIPNTRSFEFWFKN